MKRQIVIVLCATLLSGVVWAADSTKVVYADTAIYQGLNIRLDVANPIFELARSQWHSYAVEMAFSPRLKNRFYPTIELGYAGNFRQVKSEMTNHFTGQGGFMRIGLDINPLKKHPERRSYMTIGVRAGLALQYLDTEPLRPYSPQGEWITDSWGEIVAGVQVQIINGFHMGWAIRMKYLFTTYSHGEYSTSHYIPGFGFNNPMNWGFDYYLGVTI